MIRRREDCKDAFERECFDTAQRIVTELQDIYNEDVDSENGEKMTLVEYFEDCLDVDYTVNYRREYKSATIWVGLGGPNICIDTRDTYVRLYWGCTQVEVPFPYVVRDEIDDIFAEYYSYAA